MKPYYWFSIILFTGILFTTELQAKIYYVTPTGAGAQNGNSWSTAYGNLQTAILNAAAGDTIWVRAGTYTPTTVLTPGKTNALTYFGLNKNLKIFGGFAGNETSFSQRNWINNKTILNGDTNGNDNNTTVVSNNTNKTDNKKRIFIITGNLSGAELDGFTIRNSYAPTNSNSDLIYNSVTIETIHDNFVIKNCTGFTLRNIHFTRNFSNNRGGLNILSSTVTIDNISFYDNISNQVGNAFDQSTVYASNLFIRKQVSTTYASGLSLYTSSGWARNVYIDSCTSTNYGILDIYQSNFNLNKIEIARNSSGSYGPISIESSTTIISNTLIHNNSITGSSTGINILSPNNGMSGANNVTIVNATITKNTLGGSGNKYAVFNYNSNNHNQIRLYNSILHQPNVLNFNNNFQATSHNYSRTAIATNSNLGNNIVNTTSPFTNYNNNDFMLALSSEARNVADSTRLISALGTTNLNGQYDVYDRPRINQNGRLDMGAIEDTLIDAILNSSSYSFTAKQYEKKTSVNIELSDHPFQTATLKGGLNHSDLRKIRDFDIRDITHFKHQELVEPDGYTYFELWGTEPNGHQVLIGIQKLSLRNQVNLKVYPNPADNQLQLNTGNKRVNQLIVYDINGRAVKTITVSIHQSLHTLNISDLKPGTYWLKAISIEDSNAVQFIKR